MAQKSKVKPIHGESESLHLYCLLMMSGFNMVVFHLKKKKTLWLEPEVIHFPWVGVKLGPVLIYSQ